MKKTLIIMVLIPMAMTAWVAISASSTGLISERVLIATIISYLLIPIAIVLLIYRVIKSKKVSKSEVVLGLVSLTGLPVPLKSKEAKEKEPG